MNWLRPLARGAGGILVMRGEAGMGKSALLEYANTVATDMRVRKVRGVETEADLAFAALHFLLRRDLGFIDELPSRQAAALRAAFGLAEARETDPFFVGLALLSFLSGLSKDRPLLLLIDDAQWLDRASAEAILIAARRLMSNGIAIMFAIQEPALEWSADDLPTLRLASLSATAADELLRARAAYLAPEARDRVLERAQGNPLLADRVAGPAAGLAAPAPVIRDRNDDGVRTGRGGVSRTDAPADRAGARGSARAGGPMTPVTRT